MEDSQNQNPQPRHLLDYPWKSFLLSKDDLSFELFNPALQGQGSWNLQLGISNFFLSEVVNHDDFVLR